MTPIEKALVIILDDIACKRGHVAYLHVINQHFSTVEEAKKSEKRARKDIDDVILELKS